MSAGAGTGASTTTGTGSVLDSARRARRPGDGLLGRSARTKPPVDADAQPRGPAADAGHVPIGPILRGLLDLVAPRTCPACDEPLPPGQDGFCEACAPLLDPGERLGHALAAYVYGGPMADAICALKYGGRTEHAPVLGRMLAERALELAGEVDAVVPVPLHPARLRQRGFNQSALLARPVARALAVPLVTSELRRIRDTPPQASLSARARATNVRGAFVALRAPAPRVLLVDDVRTTGATLAECADALVTAGVDQVVTLVLARADEPE